MSDHLFAKSSSHLVVICLLPNKFLRNKSEGNYVQLPMSALHKKVHVPSYHRGRARPTADTIMADEEAHFHRRPTPQSTNVATNGTLSTKCPAQRPKRIPSILYGEDDAGESSIDVDHNSSIRSLETTSTASTALHDAGSATTTRRRTNNRRSLDTRLTKSMSTPTLRGQTSLDAICRAERRSNRERHAVGTSSSRMDHMLLLSERRSLSPISRHRPRAVPPSRLSLLGSHTFYHRNDDSDYDDDASDRRNNDKHGLSGSSGSGKPFTRRTTLPENIKPMQNDNASTVIEPGAMRYLPKILRDIYAQRQTRRPSLVSLCLLLLLPMFVGHILT